MTPFKDFVPGASTYIDRRSHPRFSLRSGFFTLLLIAAIAKTSLYVTSFLTSSSRLTSREASSLQSSINKCKAAKGRVGPPPNFAKRTRNDRQLEDAAPILLRNVSIWTGKPSTDTDDFGEILPMSDVLVDKGLIRQIAKMGDIEPMPDMLIIEGFGKWLTPGIVDVHVHAAGATTPRFTQTCDINSFVGPTQPYLRVIDGAHPHDVDLASIASGGVTTALMLPGSANSIGGQAYPIKMGRFTKQQVRQGGWTRTVEPPTKLVLPGEGVASRNELFAPESGMRRNDDSTSWRFVKMACGENPKRFYNQTRMDEAYHFRSQFTKARALLERQDDFCSKTLPYDGKSRSVRAGTFTSVDYPDDLDLEALVDVLRGKAKVNVHCYTIEDMTSFVSITNEFSFPVAAFHHADEAYLIPDLLKKTYGGPPAIAMFSLLADYNIESYYNSPFALKILTEEGFQVHIKSDHTVTDSRRLIVQVAQAHHYGLPAGVALRSVTSSAAKLLGLDHRLGQVKPGMDADLVLWDRFPLQLGATPLEVIIDGNREALRVDDSLQRGLNVNFASEADGIGRSYVPPQADFRAEISRVKDNYPAIVAGETVAFPVPKIRAPSAVCHNVARIYQLDAPRPDDNTAARRVVEKFVASSRGDYISVAFADGKLTDSCKTIDESCRRSLANYERQLDLRGGSIIPGLIAVHRNLGQADIVPEPSAYDLVQWGNLVDPMSRAVDSLMFDGHELRRAAAAGVRTVVVAPTTFNQPKAGIYTHFDALASQRLDDGAIRKREVGLLLIFRAGETPPIAGHFTRLRGILHNAMNKVDAQNDGTAADSSDVWRDVVNGAMPLIVDAASAEIITRVVELKEEFSQLRLVIRTASEASFGGLPKLLKDKDIGVLVDTIQWSQRYDERRGSRIGGVYAEGMENQGQGLPSANTTKPHMAGSGHAHIPSLLGVLHKAGVRVGVFAGDSAPVNTLLWNVIEAGQRIGISRQDALDLAVGRVADIMDLPLCDADLVAFEGDVFEYGARAVAMMSRRGVDLMDI